MNCCCSFSAVATASSRALSISAITRACSGRSADGTRFKGCLPDSASRSFSAATAGSGRAGPGATGRLREEKRPIGPGSVRGRAADAVADAADCLDEPVPLPGVELLAERVDVYVDDIGRKLEGVLPDTGLDLRARDDLAAPTQQQLEERTFPRGQPHDLRAARHLARFGIVGQLPEDERTGLGDLGAAGQGTQTGEQLAEREGLDQVV